MVTKRDIVHRLIGREEVLNNNEPYTNGKSALVERMMILILISL